MHLGFGRAAMLLGGLFALSRVPLNALGVVALFLMLAVAILPAPAGYLRWAPAKPALSVPRLPA